MEENNGLVEQPTESASITEETQSGSMYGKFKDATSMLKAYQNLEAEFTRKSQRVSALEKMLEESKSETASQNDSALTEEKNEEKSSENAVHYESDKSSWQASVKEFFAANPDAGEYKSRMSRILHENPEYTASPKCLELAYKLAKSEGLKRPAELTKDQKFIEEYVLTDSRIKDIIINEYISSISRGGAPRILPSSPAVQAAMPKQSAPKTIKEASMLAKKYFG